MQFSARLREEKSMAAVVCVLHWRIRRLQLLRQHNERFAVSLSPHGGLLQVYSWSFVATVDDVDLISLLKSGPLLLAFNGMYSTSEPRLQSVARW